RADVPPRCGIRAVLCPTELRDELLWCGQRRCEANFRPLGSVDVRDANAPRGGDRVACRVLLMAISRYGIRTPPGVDAIIEACRRSSRLIEGPDIAEFERRFAERAGQGTAIATSF